MADRHSLIASSAAAGRTAGRKPLLPAAGRRPPEAGEATTLGHLLDVSHRLWHIHTLNEGLQELLDASIEMMAADLGHIQVYDPEAKALRIAVQRGFESEFLDFFATVRADQGSACARALVARGPVVIEDVERDAAFAPLRKLARAAGFRAVVSAPIVDRSGMPLGMISVHYRTVRRPSAILMRRLDLYRTRAADFMMRIRLEEGLRAAIAASDAATRAKSRFVAAVGHDLRQPLQVIRLMQAMLAERFSHDADAMMALRMLDDANDDIAALAETLLDAHQVGSEVIQPEIEEFEIRPLLARLHREFAPIAAEKGLDLRLVRSSQVVESDRRLLSRIIGNIISNAIKYTDRGKILVGCRRAGKNLRIEVLDTGIGIAPDELERVFDEFHRGEGASGHGRGLGYGLYIAERFASALGHRLTVRSRVGVGTAFSIELPSPSGLAAGDGGTPGKGRNGARSILVVEDHSVQLHALVLLLKGRGYAVSGVGTGPEAMALLDARAGRRIDAVITDYNLPGGMDGLQVIAAIEARLGHRVPSLVVTGAKGSAAITALERTGRAVLYKPVHPAELLEAVDAMFPSEAPD